MEAAAHWLRLELDRDELIALFRLLRRDEHVLGEELARVARAVERSLYERLTIQEIEQIEAGDPLAGGKGANR